MTGIDMKLAAFMQGSNKRFVIPVYQRNYDWRIENCKQLFDDLVRVIRNRRKTHFFGSIVAVYDSNARNEEFLIIDGQQRLTTVSLIFLAMYNLLASGHLAAKEARLGERIFKEYLIDEYHEEESRVKLKPVKNDSNAFSRLFGEASDHVQDSNVTINYNYFHDRIRKEEVSIDELFDAICRLEIINIKLNHDDNPQLIFESLNSTGMALSEGDKIRNYILMGLPSRKQREVYEKYWHKIELCTKYDVSSFIRDYLSVKQQSIPSQSRVYFTFKEYVEEDDLQTEELLQDILNYARRYETLLEGNTSSIRLNAAIHRLNRLETTVTRPFFLEVLRLHNEGGLSIEQVADAFSITESYLFRRTICDLPTNALNKIFLLLHKEIMRYDKTEHNYIDKLKYAILSKRDRGRFPLDDEFVAAFSERQVYSMNRKNKIYMMERFENSHTLEDKDVYRHVDAGTYSIEHIMPQHLTPAWIQELGDNFEEIHSTWLHRLANLTLTAYNAQYSNSPFSEKKTAANGFEKSGIRMNVYIAKQHRWSEDELALRNQHLMEEALTIWPEFSTEYAPEEKQLDTYTLDDDEVLRGRVITRFEYKNTEQPVVSWVEMFESVLRMLHAEDKSVLSKVAYSPTENEELAPYVSRDKESLRSHIELDNGLYVEKNTSTEMKLSLLRRVFRLFNADPADLTFYLKDYNERSNDAGLGIWEENRLRYWTYALPYIKDGFDQLDPFRYSNPTKSNWMAGFFGIGGLNISCVANYNEARVELYMGGETHFNKMMFDHLYAKKSEIEAVLGTELNWDRGDNKKSSKISISLFGVNVALEDNWQQMTAFFAAWSRKFYDALVPPLKDRMEIL